MTNCHLPAPELSASSPSVTRGDAIFQCGGAIAICLLLAGWLLAGTSPDLSAHIETAHDVARPDVSFSAFTDDASHPVNQVRIRPAIFVGELAQTVTPPRLVRGYHAGQIDDDWLSAASTSFGPHSISRWPDGTVIDSDTVRPTLLSLGILLRS